MAPYPTMRISKYAQRQARPTKARMPNKVVRKAPARRKTAIPKAIPQVNSMFQRYATFKSVDTFSTNQQAFTLESMASTLAGSNGLTTMKARFEEWLPYSLSVTIYPRASNGKSVMLTTAIDLNENKAQLTYDQLLVNYPNITHCLKEGSPVRRTLKYDQAKHKHWINCVAPSDAHGGVSGQLGPWASTIFAAFFPTPVTPPDTVTHIACDVCVTLTCLFRGFQAGPLGN